MFLLCFYYVYVCLCVFIMCVYYVCLLCVFIMCVYYVCLLCVFIMCVYYVCLINYNYIFSLYLYYFFRSKIGVLNVQRRKTNLKLIFYIILYNIIYLYMSVYMSVYSLNDFKNIKNKGTNNCLSEIIKQLLLQISNSITNSIQPIANTMTPYNTNPQKNVENHYKVKSWSSSTAAATHNHNNVHTQNKKYLSTDKKNITSISTSSTSQMKNKPEETPLIKVRLLLNKLTDKNFDEFSDKIMRILNLYGLDNELAINIFHILANNQFYVQIYAKLYVILINKFEIMNTILTNNINSFFDKFKDIQYVGQTDYLLFCKMNEDMDSRKTLSLFLSQLNKNNVINTPTILHLIVGLLNTIAQSIDHEKYKNLMDELCEHVFILLNIEIIRHIKTQQINMTIQYKLKEYDIFEFIHFLSVSSIKEYEGLTSKSKFKFGDTYQIIKQ